MTSAAVTDAVAKEAELNADEDKITVEGDSAPKIRKSVTWNDKEAEKDAELSDDIIEDEIEAEGRSEKDQERRDKENAALRDAEKAAAANLIEKQFEEMN